MATVMAARWVNNGGKGREIRLADYHHMDIWPIYSTIMEITGYTWDM